MSEKEMSSDVITCCRYNRGIDCTDRSRCPTCGWNPFVSMQRMIERFGFGSEDYLSVFKKDGHR